MLAEHHLTVDLNNLAPVFVPLTAANAQLDTARKVFMDAHPLAKDKEQLALAKAKRGGQGIGAPTWMSLQVCLAAQTVCTDIACMLCTSL